MARECPTHQLTGPPKTVPTTAYALRLEGKSFKEIPFLLRSCFKDRIAPVFAKKAGWRGATSAFDGYDFGTPADYDQSKLGNALNRLIELLELPMRLQTRKNKAALEHTAGGEVETTRTLMPGQVPDNFFCQVSCESLEELWAKVEKAVGSHPKRTIKDCAWVLGPADKNVSKALSLLNQEQLPSDAYLWIGKFYIKRPTDLSVFTELPPFTGEVITSLCAFPLGGTNGAEIFSASTNKGHFLRIDISAPKLLPMVEERLGVKFPKKERW
jgi:hypothetical protein